MGNSRLQPWVRVQVSTAWIATGTCGAEPLTCGVQGDSSRIQLNCRAPSRCHGMAWCVCGGRGPTPLVRAVTGTWRGKRRREWVSPDHVVHFEKRKRKELSGNRRFANCVKFVAKYYTVIKMRQNNRRHLKKTFAMLVKKAVYQVQLSLNNGRVRASES